MDSLFELGREEPDGELRSVLDEGRWRVDLTNADVRDARHRWLVAHDGGGPDALIDLLYQDYVHLISAQAQQIADDLRRGPGLGQGPVRAQVRGIPDVGSDRRGNT